MDVTSIIKPPADEDKPCQSPASGQPCPTSEAGGIEVFELRGDKFYPMAIETIRNMRTSYLCHGPWLMKLNGLYYCGNDAIWNKLENRSDSRRWIHDYVVDNLIHYCNGVLAMPVSKAVKGL